MIAICCDAWGGPDYASCIVSERCDAPKFPIEVAIADGGGVLLCPAGSTQCSVTAYDSCCTEDCGESDACLIGAPAPRPLCCGGYCGEPRRCDAGVCALAADPGCTGAPSPLDACCTADAITLAAAAWTSVEWTVGFGDRVEEAGLPAAADIEADAEPEPDAAPRPRWASESGGCAVGAHEDGGATILFFLVLIACTPLSKPKGEPCERLTK